VTAGAWIVGTLVLCLVQGYLLWRPAITVSRGLAPSYPGIALIRPAPPLLRPNVRPRSGHHGDPAAIALDEARWWRMQAMVLANADREAIEGWGLADSADPEVLRRQLMQRDRCGYLHRARTAALRAASLVHKNRQQAYRAAELLVCIECESGDHQTELQHARKLLALAPHNWTTQMVLNRAERCSHLHPPLPALAARPRAAAAGSAQLATKTGSMETQHAG
jgi:hypothetical protein